MKRRVLSTLLALCLVLGLMPGTARAADTPTSGTCGENATWSLSGGTLTILGKGSMDNYNNDSHYYPSSPWYNQRLSITSVVIGDGITSIGRDAFDGCYNLTSIAIPDSVTSIGELAFDGCNSLANVTIPNSVTSIGNSAFRRCYYLTGITIPDGVTSIGRDAFQGCAHLSNINIPNSVTEIGSGAFAACTDLTSVIIPNSVTKIESDTFKSCRNLTSVVIPNSVTSIGPYAFKNCQNLSSVIIPDSVTFINEGSFEDCSRLTSVTIPASVRTFARHTFRGCTGLTSAGPIGGGYNYEFGWTTTIPEYAFEGCTRLTSITIPGSVRMIHDATFEGCTALTSAGPIGGGYDYEFGWTDAIPDNAFANCSGLTSVTIPNSVTRIGTDVFENCKHLTNLIIPNSVTHISWGAFENCDGLTSAGPIGGGYSYEFGWTDAIPDNAFENCTRLTSVTIPDSITKIGKDVFAECSSLTCVTIPNSVTRIMANAFKNCRDLTSVIISDSVTYIDGGTFTNCSNLTNVTIPDSVTSIGGSAFSGCNSLTSITIPNSVTSIGYGAFAACSSLTNITIPNGVDRINKRTFNGCSGMTSITIPNSVTRIEDEAFDGCSSLTDVYFGGSKSQWDTIKIGTNNQHLTSATIHYNGGGVDDPLPPSGDITFRSDDNYIVYVGDKTLLLASISGTAGLKESDIQWTSSNEAVAKIIDSGALMGSDTATSVATIEGVSFGKATLTVTLPDGRSNSCEITVKDKPNTIVITNGKSDELSPGTTYFIPINSSESLHTKIKMNIIVPDDEIVWTSSDGNILSFDDAGTTTVRQPIAGHPFDDDSCIKDSVTVYARNTGKVKLTCGLSSMSDAKQEINIVVFRDETKSFEKLNKNFNDNYNNYIKEVMSLLKKNQNQVSGTTIDQQAEILMQQDKGSTKLVNFHDFNYEKNEAAKKNIYKAVAQFLAESVEGIDLKNISVSGVDTTQIGVDVAKAVLNGLDTKEYTYKYGGTTVKIKGMTANGAFLRRIHYRDTKTGGFVWVADLVSKPQQAEKCIIAYVKELMLLEKNLVKEAYNQVKKEFVNLGFKGLGSMTKDIIKENIGPYVDAFEKTGAGKVVTAVSVSLDYYNYLQKIINLAQNDPLALMSDLVSMKGLSFEPKSIKDKTVDMAMKGLDEAKNKVDEAVDEFITTGTVDIDKLMKGWFKDTTSGMIAEIKCPVNITIYDANGTKLGYVGDDDVWYDEDIISIDKTGDLKTIYSHDKDLRFEMVGTDYGTVNCTFEEYSNGVAVGRVNYYDIPVQEGKTIYATVPSENISDKTVDVSSGGENIRANECISSSDYNSSTATITCAARPVAGGQAFGAGTYTRGDIATVQASAAAGYEFVGWEDSAGELLSTDNTYELTAKENAKLIAVFQEYKELVLYAVTLDATGGTVSAPVLVTDGDGKLSSLPTPTYDGYTFDGWYTAAEGGERIVDGTVFTENTTIYAHWTNGITPPAPTACTITFDPADGTVTPAVATTNEDGKLTMLPTPIRDGYTFDGWYTAAIDGTKISLDTVFTEDTTLYAHWRESIVPGHTHNWSVAWNSDATHHWHECIVEGCPITTNSSKDGYGAHVYDNDTDTTCDTCGYIRTIVTPPDPSDWAETYYISVPQFTGGEIIPSTRNAERGERVTLTVRPDAGYELDSITVTTIRNREIALRSLGDGRYSFTMPDSRVSVGASFIKAADNTVSMPSEDEPFTGLGTPGISGIVLNPATMPFRDVSANNWYYNSVDYVWKHYLMSGVSDTQFAPELTTSRAMIWTILARMNNVRTDINPGSIWYEKGMLWAMERGVTDGSNPMGDITREQLATMLWRNAGSLGGTADLSQFSDSEDVSQYALTAVRWATANGILQGSDGKLNPKGTATRAQVAAMVQRYGEKVGR